MTQPDIGQLDDMIVDFCDVAGSEHQDAKLSFPQYLGKRYALRGLGTIPDLSVAIETKDFGVTLVAFINQGRWMLQCPVCRSGVWACHHMPYFMCPGCGNAGSGKWFKAKFPTVKKRQAIESELLKIPGFRSHAPDRNWRANDKGV